ncbi:hypothetical protein STHU_10660 [Allostella humosa]|nr:hypothetical protein STHU_10660 [Stella humosa]
MAALALAGGTATASAQKACEGKPDETRLHITVKGVRAAAGELTITIYPDDAARFLSPRGRIARIRVPAAKPVTTGCVAVPAPGNYAAAVYHDEDGDRKFGRSMVGLPTEGYGFSNDAPATLGLPTLEQARFAARVGDNKLTIHLKY